MSKRDSGLFDNTGGSRESLIRRVREHGDKISPERVLAIGRKGNEIIVWIEQGWKTTAERNGSGLEHVLEEHRQDFMNKHVEEEDIPQLLVDAATKGIAVGYDGDRTVFEYDYRGNTLHIAITIGNNGYIVGANPVDTWKDKPR